MYIDYIAKLARLWLGRLAVGVAMSASNAALRMRSLSRRQFMLGAAFAALCSKSVRGATQPFFRRHGLPLGLQMYTVAEAAQKDLGATLDAIARMGYETVEMAGLYQRTPAEWRDALRHARLHCVAAHVSPRPSGPGPSLSDEPSVIAKLAETIGIKTIVCPLFYIPDRFDLKTVADENRAQMLARLGAALTEQDWRKTADFLNAKAAALKQVGLRFAYHNHNAEFAPIGQTTGMAILLENTDPALVSFEMDAGWVAAAGVDPNALLSAHPGRFTGMHIKDIAAGAKSNYSFDMQTSAVGKGTIDWSKLLSHGYQAGVREFYVEQEPPFARPPLEEAAASAEFLRALG